jgi:hypothetical protein
MTLLVNAKLVNSKVIYKIYNPKIKDERAINFNTDIYISTHLTIA